MVDSYDESSASFQFILTMNVLVVDIARERISKLHPRLHLGELGSQWWAEQAFLNGVGFWVSLEYH